MNIIKYISEKAIIIPPKWKMPASILSGIIVGMTVLIVYLSNAASYLSEKPETCINCHVMTDYYVTWEHSSHRQWTTCNDCHVPHDNFLTEAYFHVSDGARHSIIFTLKAEPQVLQIREPGKEAVQSNCLRCHINTVNPVSATNVSGKNYKHGEGKLCWECHREVPHGRVHSQASTPYAIVPLQKPVFIFNDKMNNINNNYLKGNK